MFSLKTAWTRDTRPVAAATELAGQIQQSSLRLIGFFASARYDFAAVAEAMQRLFPDVPTVGCTTAGELAPGLGYGDGTLTAFSIAADDFDVAALVIPDIKRKAIMGKGAVMEAARRLRLGGQNGFGLVMIDGLQAAEERVVMMLNSALPDLPIVGGSAGDDLAFRETKVALNGKTYSDAAVITLVRTGKRLMTYRENIYVPTGARLRVEASDLASRTVSRINGMTAVAAYASAVGCRESDVQKHFHRNPLGKVLGSQVWIASPQRTLPDGSIAFYTQIMAGTTLRLLQSADAHKVARQTADIIRQQLPGAKALLAFNCILRYLQFKEERACESLYAELNGVAPVVGFTTYGEQMKHHVNQTLVLLGIGD